jgi:SAM-dependent methyltransferase
MSDSIASDYYNALAKDYHLLYRDWDSSMEREGMMLRRWFRDREIVTVLDASCGTGRQAVALAQIGYRVLAADPSMGMLQQAQAHAEALGLADRIHFLQAGFLDLARMVDTAGALDAILTKGDAFPHLISDADIEQTLHGFFRLLRPGGTLLIGMRDFERLIQERPRLLPGQVHEPDDYHGERIITYEVWDWSDESPLTVTINHFITRGEGQHYHTACYPIRQRALTPDEVEVVLVEAGFEDVRRTYDRSELVMLCRKPETST